MKFVRLNKTDGSIVRVNIAHIVCMWIDNDGNTCIELTTGRILYVWDSPMDIIESCEEDEDEH